MPRMQHFKGASGDAIDLDETDVIITKKGPGSNLQGVRQPRRIPIAAIREVLFKEPGLNNGFIYLVLGDRPPPDKTGFLQIATEPEAVTFRAGKQAKAFRQLRDHLQSWIDYNRSIGLDPASVSVPNPAENTANAMEAAKRSFYAGTYVVREELGAAATNEEVIDAARQSSAFAGIRTTSTLPSRLAPGEQIEMLALGDCLLVLTDRRVIAVMEEPGARMQVYEEAGRDRVRAVSWDSRTVRGGLTITTLAHAFTIKALSPDAANLIIAALSPASVSTDVIDQIRRLDELRAAGIVTDEEFQAKRADLLRRL